MHIVIPYAAPAGASIQQALSQVQLPHLSVLLKRLEPTEHTPASPAAWTPLHELLLARQTWPGVDLPDGLFPWAAADARARPLNRLESHSTAWAWLTLCHWVIQADHVDMDDPAQLQVTPEESRTLQDAMRTYFAEDGITLHPQEGGTWLAQGEVFRDLPTASLDRVRGSKVDAWMPRQPQAKPLRRLQNEMQMLLYTHPLNDARAARGLRAINAFWVSGTGALPVETATATATGMVVHHDLRAAALRDDAAAWLQAWRALDSGPIAELLQRIDPIPAETQPQLALTLCGDNAAQTFALRPRTLWTRVARHFATPDLPRLLRSL